MKFESLRFYCTLCAKNDKQCRLRSNCSFWSLISLHYLLKHSVQIFRVNIISVWFYPLAKKLKLQQIGSFRVLNGKVDLSTHEYQLTLEEWENKLANLRDESNVKYITKEINVSKTVQTVKVLAYKNGEGRMRPGEIICGSSIDGVGWFKISLSRGDNLWFIYRWGRLTQN